MLLLMTCKPVANDAFHFFTVIRIRCVAADPITRLAGAISLWSIEIVMQVRIYALYQCSKKVGLSICMVRNLTNLRIPTQIALFNGILFLGSIGSFLWIMVHNYVRRRAMIAGVMHLPLPGCPSINGGIQWAQWVPGTFSLRPFQYKSADIRFYSIGV